MSASPSRALWTGSLSATQLSRCPSASSKLSRLQGAGVQAITYAGIMQIVTHFTLPPLGLQRLDEAISRLPVYSSTSQLLYFGFGHRSFFRQLTESVSGLKVIALCSTLAESHHENMAASVLSSLWRKLDYPEDFQPCFGQFKSLVKACSGVFTTSHFPLLVGRMLPARLRAQQYPLEVTDSDGITNALVALFDISQGRRDRLVLVGDAEGSFFAAMAYWFLDLDVAVDDVDGTRIFATSVKKGESNPTGLPQVHVLYRDAASPSPSLVSESTVILASVNVLLQPPEDGCGPIRWRVEWDRCLSAAWPEHCNTFSLLRGPLSSFFGLVGRIVDDENLRGVCSALIKTLLTRFPEISPLVIQDDMDEGYNAPPEEAKKVWVRTMHRLQSACHCGTCHKASGSVGAVSFLACLTKFLWTAVRLTHVLSSIVLDADDPLWPVIPGLRNSWISIPPGAPPLVRRDLNEMREFVSEEGAIKHRMLGALRLFTIADSVIHEWKGKFGLIAIWHQAVCVALNLLLPESATVEDLFRVRVMRGQIGHYHSRAPLSPLRVYQSISDVLLSGGFSNISAPPLKFSLVSSDDLCSSLTEAGDLGFAEGLVAEVTESKSDPSTLHFWVWTRVSLAPISIRPSWLIKSMYRAAWSVCDGRLQDSPRCPKLRGDFLGTVAIIQEGGHIPTSLNEQVTAVYWGKVMEHPARRLAVLELLSRWSLPSGPLFHILLQRAQNHRLGACCVKKAKELKDAAYTTHANRDGRLHVLVSIL